MPSDTSIRTPNDITPVMSAIDIRAIGMATSRSDRESSTSGRTVAPEDGTAGKGDHPRADLSGSL